MKRPDRGRCELSRIDQRGQGEIYLGERQCFLFAISLQPSFCLVSNKDSNKLNFFVKLLGIAPNSISFNGLVEGSLIKSPLALATFAALA